MKNKKQSEMKLKTLKDLKLRRRTPGGLIFLDEMELKAEAVKWAKKFKFQADESRHRETIGYWLGKMQVLIDFFNLTSEDLK